MEGDERTVVERSLGVTSGVGNVPVDARLTALGEKVILDGTGGTLEPAEGSALRGLLSLSVPTGAVGAATEFRLTPLTPQGLPGLLPLGFSPIVAFDLRATAALGLPISAEIAGLPEGALYVTRYDTTSHAFMGVEGPVEAVAGALTVSVPAPGTYVLVATDAGDPLVSAPVPGQPLLGVPMVELGVTVTSEGVVTPKTLPPTGGTATGGLKVHSPVALPSGTVVQTEVVETYTLASGAEASSEPRSQDILLFRTECGRAAVSAEPGDAGPADPGVLCAALPITPSRSYRTDELTEGRVHLDILAGRESVRGTTGGSDPLTLKSEGVVLTVPGLSLTKDTALSLRAATGFSSFLPEESGLEALQELVLDFSGQSLGLAAGLSVSGTTAVPGDTVILARVERVQGIPRLAVVSLASVDATGKVTTVAHPDLPGVTREGRYVFYRLGVPVGIVKGTASAGGKALVAEATGLSFIAVASGSGAATHFVLVTLTGPITVNGSVPGTSLQGTAATTVEPPVTANVVLALSGTLTTASVTPADGASNLPTNTQLVITSPTPLAPASVTTDKLKLRKVADGGLVPLKLLVSGSAKVVSAIPQSPPPTDEQEPVKPPLEFSAEYRLEAAELTDVHGGLVQVPETSFTTKDDVPPVYDYGQLRFRLQNGVVTLLAPDQTFPPGTQILIINGNTGEVASFTVDNDGGFSLDDPFPATFLASADHTLVVTITDPLGNTTTFTKSQFVTDDGTVLVGPGGGVVTGEGGVELRIPEGALDKGVELKLKGMSTVELEALFPGQAPGLGQDAAGVPLAKIGSGVELKSEQKPSFKKPVDLAFPVPPEAFAAAQAEGLDEKVPYFYVVRRIEGPCATGATSCPASERSVAYQTIDHAFVECPVGKPTCAAEEKKVVTASWPFGGYADFTAGFSALPGSGFLLQTAAVSYAYLMWTFERDLPEQALPGAITGKVQRTEWNPGALTPTYKPVEGAYVTGVEEGGPRLLSGGSANVAITDKDGRFTLWDPAFKGGTVTLAATLKGAAPEVTCPVESDTVVCATGFEANVADWKTSGLRFHKNIATLNLTFPPQEPPPAPPAIAIGVYRLVEGQRQVTGGLVPVGTPLVIGITPTEGIELRDVTVQGEGLPFVVDPLKGQATGHEFIVETTPGQVATYRVKALGLNFRAEAIESQTTFRAIGAGGADETVEGQRPEVLDPDTRPKNKAKGVPVGTSIYVRFSEPVKKVLGNIALEDPAGNSVGVLISGTLIGGGIIDVLRTSPDAVVTSLTLQPLQGLVYTTGYTLELGDGIEDLDTVPQKLVPYTTSFETFGPVSLREGDPTGFGAVGVVILEDRAYLMEGGVAGGTLLVYETSDPVSPQPIPSGDGDPRDPRFFVQNRPVDISGEAESPLGLSRVVAVSTSSTSKPQPSNVWLLDVSDDAQTNWIGAVSFASSPTEGWIERTFMKSGVLYAASFKKGIQVVDLAQVRDNFKDVATDALAHFRMRADLHTNGRGYGGEDVVSIPVPGPAGAPARLTDIEAAVVRTAAEPKLLVTAAGDTGLIVVDPGSLAVLSNEPVTVRDDAGTTLATLIRGTALAMGTVGDKDLTVVFGTGTIGTQPDRSMLVVVSLVDPANPVGLGFVEIGDPTVEDVILKDDLALLGGATYTTVVSLADPAQPRVAGIIRGIAGRLALTPEGLLFGSTYARFGGTDIPLGGVRTATLKRLLLVQSCVRSVSGEECVPNATIPFGADNKTEVPVEVRYRIVPPAEPAQTIKVAIIRGEAPIQDLPPEFDGLQGASIWPEDTPISPLLPYFAQATTDEGTSEELTSPLVRLQLSDILLELTKEQALFAAAESDGQTSVSNTWDGSGTGVEPPVNKWDYKNSTRTFTKAIASSLGRAPRLPDDYVILKIGAAGALVWEESGGTTLRVDVPDNGRILAKLKATKAVEALSVERIIITAEYYPDAKTTEPLKLTDDWILLMNERLHGLLYDAGTAAIGRGEGLSGAVVELGVGLIPFVGDGAGMLGEIINAFDPSTDASKLNFVLSLIGIATEFSQITGPAGVALDKGVVFLRIGLRRIAPFTTGPLKRIPGILYDAAKVRNWDLLLEWAEGSMKLAMVSGELVARIAKTEIDLTLLNRFLARYSDNAAGNLLERVLNTRFAEQLKLWDEIYADPDAVRGAVRALGDFKDEFGNVIQLSDQAAEGAVKFMARAGNGLTAAEKEEILTRLLAAGKEDAEASLRFVREATSPEEVQGLARFFKDMDSVPCAVIR